MARFEKTKIARYLDDSTDCAWSETLDGSLVIHGLNSMARITVQRVVTALGGQMHTQDLGDGIKVLVISRAKR